MLIVKTLCHRSCVLQQDNVKKCTAVSTMEWISKHLTILKQPSKKHLWKVLKHAGGSVQVGHLPFSTGAAAHLSTSVYLAKLYD